MAATLSQSTVVFVLRDVVETMRTRVARRPVKIDLVVADETSSYTVSDPEKLRQIAFNIMNAAALSTERGRVTLILGKDEQCLKLTVTDTGIGFTKEALERITSPSRPRTDRIRNDRDLRLILTRTLLDLLGGSMSISSKPGEGTIVEVWLPLRENCRSGVAAIPLEMSVCIA